MEFLREITNTRLGGLGVVRCLGISQDPKTNNYIMVMDHMENGNLRQVLQSKNNKLSFKDKLENLKDIAYGLDHIHKQNLVHRDLHSGNILNNNSSFNIRAKKFYHSLITDLGLSQPANFQKQENQIFGVLPYVAPEVLRGQPYTTVSDIYSFGIVAYELLANAYPYPKMDDINLALAVCQGYRPNIDEVPIPQSLKDLIKKCWDVNPSQRPGARELLEIISDWIDENVYKRIRKNTPFYRQYRELKDEYNTFSQKPY
ncbi:MAG: hypothetical protein MRERC_7c007 [Mycoplasmataceae bacterium RC_NB112A]|nr:MAG: hypothetical protein MRERC_10c048 [Mycoplasmataceae bacterium RC_NB112A]KLL01857.1 MAG: hypothetical protein MRERC_7c007 [Mycoplasmataceae bacterium RC_NB112A]